MCATPTRKVFVEGSSIEYVPASHEDPTNPGVLKRVLFAADIDVSGELRMLNWARLEPGKSFAPHYHQDMIEFFIVVSGAPFMEVEGHVYNMVVGDAVVVHPNQVHSMSNLTDSPVEYVVFGISKGQGGKTICINQEGPPY
jgi:quercetin dioxygenase-like cupin family protein